MTETTTSQGQQWLRPPEPTERANQPKRPLVSQIATAKELLDGGAITQAEFEAIKAKALA